MHDGESDGSHAAQVETGWLALVERLRAGEPLPAHAACLFGGPEALDRAVGALTALGLPIVVDRQDGSLRWRPGPDPLDAGAIAATAATLGGSCPVEVRALVDSTSTRLASEEGAGLPRALLAECQWAGRGRRGRRWQAGYGEAVLMSVRLALSRPPAQRPGLALAAGCAVAVALAPLLTRPPALKWPNDLVVDGGKLGGLLVEAAGDGSLVIGLGLNWSLSASLADGLGRPVANLADLLAGPCGRNELAGRLLAALLAASTRFDREGLAPFLACFAGLDALAGREVVVESAAGVRAGRACGLAGDGALRVDHDGQVVAYHSAEVTLAWP